MDKPGDPAPLTRPDYWDSVHSGAGAAAAAGSRQRDYRQYLIDETVLAPHLPARADWSLLEVGCAPGRRLLHLHDRFGWQPWGVDYSLAGVEATRRLFAARGLDASRVIQADFFSDEFLLARRGSFDVVMSHGFIEHFSDPRGVVARHVELLKPSGCLVVVIPNLRGANRLLARFFNPGVLALHHLGIMDLPAFGGLFQGLGLAALHCGYVGSFSLGLQNAPEGSWKRGLLRFGWKAQAALDLALWRLAGPRHPRSRWFSPYLAYVGRRIPPGAPPPPS